MESGLFQTKNRGRFLEGITLQYLCLQVNLIKETDTGFK